MDTLCKVSRFRVSREISMCNFRYRKTSSKSRTKFQNLNVFRLVLQLSLVDALEPGVSRE